MSATINALRPTQNPQTRFAGPAGAPMGLTGPQMPANALQMPGAPPPGAAAPAPAAAMPPVQPPPQAPPPDIGERISARVPVPPTDFHPDEHADLHKAMGDAFDKPEATALAREGYDAVREAHPHIHPKAALLAARDAFHAVQHGLATHEQAHHALRTYPALFARPQGTAPSEGATPP